VCALEKFSFSNKFFELQKEKWRLRNGIKCIQQVGSSMRYQESLGMSNIVELNHRIMVAVGSDLKIYGNSGLVIAKLETTENMISIIDMSERNMISVGESGKVCLWESTNLVKSFDLNLKITHAVGNSNYKKGIFIISFADGYYTLHRVNLNTGAVKLFKKFKRVPSCMQMSADGNYIVVGGGRRFDVFCFKDGFSKQR
jgi:hypothetical protein